MEPRQRTINLIAKGAKMDTEIILNPNPPFLSNMPFQAWAEADPNRVIFYGYRPTNADYYIGLHELGHVALGHAVERSKESKWYEENTLEGESQAWLWAIENAEEEMSPRTAEFILSDFALGSYARNSLLYRTDLHNTGYPGLNYYKVQEKIRSITYAFD